MTDDDWLPTTVGLPDRRKSEGYDHFGLIGRAVKLDELAGRIDSGVAEIALTTAADRAVTMHGQGGIGKTALAIEFCHQRRSSHSLVWWVNAESDATTGESFRALLRRAGILEPDELDLVGEAHRVLRRIDNWLAVFDNVDSRVSFDRWNPRADNGQILITSRSNQGWSNTVEVDLIDDADALEWLLLAAGNPTDEAERVAANALVQRLGGLALALTIATSSVARSSLSRYLRWFDDDAYSVMGAIAPNDPNYDKTVYTALAVARDRLREADREAAITLLEFAAFFAPDRIPMRLFTPESLGVQNEQQVYQARDALAELSIVRIDSKDRDFFSVHRLTQAVTRYYLDHPARADDRGAELAAPAAAPASSSGPVGDGYEWDVFIAYAGPDATAAEELHGYLRENCRAFVASRNIELGDEWDLTLARSQRASRYTVVLISSATTRAYYQREEIGQAVALARADSEAHRVIPVYLGGEPTENEDVPYGLRIRHGIALGNGVTLRIVADRILGTLSSGPTVARVASPKPRPATTNDATREPATEPARNRVGLWGWVERLDWIGGVAALALLIASLTTGALAYFNIGPFADHSSAADSPPTGPAISQPTADCVELADNPNRTDYTGTDLTGCALPGGTNLLDLDLSRAQADGLVVGDGQHDSVDFTDATLRDAELSGGDFHNATFDAADLTGAKLHNATVSGASFNGTNLDDAELFDLECPDGPIDWGLPIGTPARLDVEPECGPPPAP